MLNGIDPILIFHFRKATWQPNWASQIQGIPLVTESVDDGGAYFSIPIYLSERLTGLVVENESKNIEAVTDVKQPVKNTGSTAPEIKQKAVSNTTTVALRANRDSILLNTLIAMNEIIFEKLAAQEYTITYLNGPISIFEGLFDGFSSNTGDSDSLLRVQLSLSRGKQKSTQPTESISSVTGTRVNIG